MTKRGLAPDTSDSGISRRGFLQAALVGAGALAVGGALAGCQSSSSAAGAASRQNLVRLWDPFTGADGANMQKMQAAVRAELPDVDLQSVTLNWGSAYYTKLSMAASGGRPPETGVMHLSRLSGYAPGGLLEPLDTGRLAELGVRQSDFPAAAWEWASYQGKLYALPMDVHSFITFFNPDIIDKAGLLQSDGTMIPPGSAEEYLEQCRKIADTTGSHAVAFDYMLDTAQAWRLFWGLYRQTGAEYSLVPGKKAELDTDAAIKVVEFMQKVMDDKIAIRKSGSGTALACFSNKQAAIAIAGVWNIIELKTAVPSLDACPFPTLFGTPANYADSHGFVLPKQKYPNPERRDATYRVLASLVKRSLDWAKAGHIPAYQPVVESAAYQKLTPQRNYAESAQVAVYDPPVWFAGAGSDFQGQMCDALSTCLQGLSSASTAVTSMTDRMNVLLSKPSPA